MGDPGMATLAELPDLAVRESGPLRLGAAVFCGWLALLGLVLASVSGVGSWHAIGLVVLAVFGACALRLTTAVALMRRSRR